MDMYWSVVHSRSSENMNAGPEMELYARIFMLDCVPWEMDAGAMEAAMEVTYAQLRISSAHSTSACKHLIGFITAMEYHRLYSLLMCVACRSQSFGEILVPLY